MKIAVLDKPTFTVGDINLDKINALGPNGATAFYNRGGNAEKGADTIDAASEKLAIRGTTLTISGWLALHGGVRNYVYSTNGGQSWSAVLGGTNGQPREGYFDLLGISNAARNAMFNDSNSFITIDLSAYAGKNVNITVAAVSAADGQTIVPFVNITNYAVPTPEETTEAPVEDVTEAPVEDATEASTEEVTEAPDEDVTGAPVEYVTNENGDLATDENGDFIPVEEATNAETSTDASNEEDKLGSLTGCASVLPSSMLLVVATLAGAVCMRKKKED